MFLLLRWSGLRINDAWLASIRNNDQPEFVDRRQLGQCEGASQLIKNRLCSRTGGEP